MLVPHGSKKNMKLPPGLKSLDEMNNGFADMMILTSDSKLLYSQI